MTRAALPIAQAGRPKFYVWMAAICALVAFGGFSGTYWLQLPAGTFNGPGILHLHGLLFSAWTLLFLWQTWLSASRSLAEHRAWGVVGVSLATAMVFTGMAVAIRSVPIGAASGWGPGIKGTFLTSVSSMVLFSGFVGAALLNVSRPDWHKRLMLLASYSIIGAAMARVFFMLSGGGGPGVRLGNVPPPPPSLMIELLSEGVGVLLVIAGMIYDRRTRARIHPAYLIGLASVIGVAFLRRYLGPTAMWADITDRFVAFAG